MKRAIVRGVWGNAADFTGNPMNTKNFSQLQRELEKNVKHPFLKPRDYIVYVMGKRNFKFVKLLGYNCKLICDDSLMITDKKRMWINKIMCMKSAFEDYDEILWLDWDCSPQKEMPPYLWEDLGKKEKLQGPLFSFKCSTRADWRETEKNLVPQGSFVYMRDKSIPDTLLTYGNRNDIGNLWSDETHYAFYLDSLMPFSKETHLKYFEPMMISIVQGVFNQQKRRPVFWHPC